ncbi:MULTISPECIES: AAA family ATPase [Mesorhizobium]|uniref:AAA+ ATPase domain-containing protein n=1 Tax=Mesorhizobium denitrificans TaxID=2294114 RepID=A0A371XFZ6_9HYPH|nr:MULTISPECIES: AAA family ATPase [Mesorhizobium]RFC68157.1 hypothetical protein DY251_07735 [Mesorhizobium denitrificans]
MTKDYSPNTEHRLVGRSLDGVAMRAIDWLWTGWIPKGYVTLLAGETGAGKSTVLADVTARVTTGAPWPGENETHRRTPGRVLWLGSEDGISEMTKPRLVACKADCGKVINIDGAVQQGERKTFSLQDDIAGVEEYLRYARNEGNPFTMLVIDPVTSYLPGRELRKVDMNDAGQLRSILEPWLVLAQEFSIAIVCVTHFAKDTSRSMLHRVLGSAAFAQTCRSLVAVVAREGEGRHAKALVQVKVNLPEHPDGSWKFSTAKVQVASDPESGKPINATHPVWEALDSTLTPESMVGKSTRGPVSKFEAVFGFWLRQHFAEKPSEPWQLVDEVKAAALMAGMATSRWWQGNSSKYLVKKNQGGKWYCQPKTAQDENNVIQFPRDPAQ